MSLDTYIFDQNATKNETVDHSVPFEKFNEWFSEAQEFETNDPNAMSLATVDPAGLPNVRMVLLKGHDESGFVFYTNFESQKGMEIQSNMKVAACFHWKSLRRSVRIRGPVETVSESEADEYFASRPRESKLGAWASQQSRKMESKFALKMAVAKFVAKYPLSQVPRPPYWSGFRIMPVSIEFWSDRPSRLHERIIYLKKLKDAKWQTMLLYP